MLLNVLSKTLLFLSFHFNLSEKLISMTKLIKMVNFYLSVFYSKDICHSPLCVKKRRVQYHLMIHTRTPTTTSTTTSSLPHPDTHTTTHSFTQWPHYSYLPFPVGLHMYTMCLLISKTTPYFERRQSYGWLKCVMCCGCRHARDVQNFM